MVEVFVTDEMYRDRDAMERGPLWLLRGKKVKAEYRADGWREEVPERVWRLTAEDDGRG